MSSDTLKYIENALDSMVTQEDIIWLAGLLEGEGAFVLSKTTPGILLSMTDLDIVIRFKDLVARHHKITVHPTNSLRKKECYQTGAYGADAIKWMKLVLPYMGERRTKRINELILWYEEKQARKKFCKKGHDLTIPENVRYKGKYRCCKVCDRLLEQGNKVIGMVK